MKKKRITFLKMILVAIAVLTLAFFTSCSKNKNDSLPEKHINSEEEAVVSAQDGTFIMNSDNQLQKSDTKQLGGSNTIGAEKSEDKSDYSNDKNESDDKADSLDDTNKNESINWISGIW